MLSLLGKFGFPGSSNFTSMARRSRWTKNSWGTHQEPAGAWHVFEGLLAELINRFEILSRSHHCLRINPCRTVVSNPLKDILHKFSSPSALLTWIFSFSLSCFLFSEYLFLKKNIQHQIYLVSGWCSPLATHQINDANAIPALHDREERNKCRDYPAPSKHYSNAQWSHLVPVNQRLATDSIVPARRKVRPAVIKGDIHVF